MSSNGGSAFSQRARADLDCATAGIVRSAFGMGGQKCSALSRLYVHRAVAAPLLERLLQASAALRIGDPLQRPHWLGPLATETGYVQYAEYVGRLRRDGASILGGGEQLRDGVFAQGLFVRPTLAEAPVEHPLWQVEMFLPQ